MLPEKLEELKYVSNLKTNKRYNMYCLTNFTSIYLGHEFAKNFLLKNKIAFVLDAK